MSKEIKELTKEKNKLGVEVMLGAMVTDVDERGLQVQHRDGRSERINAVTKVWAAGVQASPLTKTLAEQTGEALAAAGLEAEVVDMDDFDLSEMIALETLLVITSTYGNGDPPANAEVLYEFLLSTEAPRLENLRFSVCGLGDTTYPLFAHCGKEFDRRLEELGGKRIVARQDCDVDYEDPWEEWCDQVVGVLTGAVAVAAPVAEAPAPAPVATPTRPVPAPDMTGHPVDPDAPLGTRKNPMMATVALNRQLAGGDRQIRHVEIELDGIPVPWKAGGSFAFWAPNDPALVDQILHAAGCSGDTLVQLSASKVAAEESLSLRTALIHRLELTHADARLTRLVAATGATLPECPAGMHLQVLDAVAVLTVRLDPQALASSLRPLTPRLYSIASSPKLDANRVDFVASVVRYTALGRERLGAATGWMATRLPKGSPARVYYQPAPNFTLADDDTDIIMIGPGTGIAPFRGFLQEREITGATGKSWLFFGSRYAATDFLYQDELEDWQDSGVLTRLDLAFSRDQPEKIYVQDRMLAQAETLWAWLEGGASVYVCGDAKTMAPDVHRTLQQIAQDVGGMDAAAAKAWIRALARSGRYMRDIY